MTNKELQEELRKYPDDWEIEVYSESLCEVLGIHTLNGIVSVEDNLVTIQVI